jgi:hypothetical protein
MVPQLWIWRFGKYILSAYSISGDPENLVSGSKSPDQDRTKQLYSENLTGCLEDTHPNLHIAFLLAHHIKAFGETQANGSYQSPLDYFEIGVVRIMSDVEKYMKTAYLSTTSGIEQEKMFIHDISDIRDELAMISEIIKKQKSILEDFIKDIDETVQEHHQWWKVTGAVRQLELYSERIAKIERDAERIAGKIQDQLNLKRTYAAMEDARASLRMGEQSIVQGKASVFLGQVALGFTILTVIFTPLGFMTSLFALNIEGFHKMANNNFSKSYIGGWFSKCAAADKPQSLLIHNTALAELASWLVTFLVVWLTSRSFNYYTVVEVASEPEKPTSDTANEKVDTETKPSRFQLFRRNVGLMKDEETTTV